MFRSLGVSNEGEYFYPMAKAGVLMLAAKLLAADYTECFDISITVLRAFINLIVNGLEWCNPGITNRNFDPNGMMPELSCALDVAYSNVIDKFSDKRYQFE
eukprot:sb/3478540/